MNKDLKISDIATNLELENGIWCSKKHSEISYPKEANDNFFELIEDNSFWFQHRNKCLSSVVDQYKPKGLIMDVGGGNGYVTKGLNQSGFPTFLLEPGRGGVENARKRGVENLIWSTFEDAGFKSEVIPAIGIFDVLEHIEEDEQFLNMINDHLVNKGLLYITVPAYNYLWSNEDVDAGHFRRYTINSLNKLLTKCGFEVRYGTYFFSPLPLPIYLFRSLPSKLGLNKNHSDINKHQSAHEKKGGIIGNTIQKVLNWEYNKIKNGKSISTGSSCLFVAQKAG